MKTNANKLKVSTKNAFEKVRVELENLTEGSVKLNESVVASQRGSIARMGTTSPPHLKKPSKFKYR